MLLLALLPLAAFPQGGITFRVEKLKRPDKPLLTKKTSELCNKLILSDFRKVGVDWLKAMKGELPIPYNVLAMSNPEDSLVDFDYHAFFGSVYQAYADHRPFVLSPDAVWLLISQGFARHVNSDPEKYRDLFVGFDGKTTLTVENQRIRLDAESPWEEIFPEFTRQIGEHVGAELMDALTCDFSTTTPTTRIASEITVMEAMKPYFEFVVMRLVCGIPEITLEGTTEDWQKVVDKANRLRKYDLDWWIDRIAPLLDRFVEASRGNVDTRFWRNMFKRHKSSEYGAPDVIDGWIVRFFPYDKDGRRNDLKKLVGLNALPDEIVKVDLRYIETDGVNSKSTPLELWAGFMGAEQDATTFALRPRIGWMIRDKSDDDSVLYALIAEKSNTRSTLRIRVREIPDEILKADSIGSLEIRFTEGVRIPDELARVAIGRLEITGTITEDETGRIRRMFPETVLVINEETYIPGFPPVR